MAETAGRAGAIGCSTVFVIVACSIAYACYSDSSRQSMPFDRAKALTVTAADLATDWGQNEVAAQAKYAGRSIVVSGTVSKISGAGDSHPSVEMATDDPTASVDLIVRTPADAIPLRPGQVASLGCVGARLSLENVVLDSCSLIGNSAGDPDQK